MANEFPRDAWAVVERMHAKFGQELPATEDGARLFTLRCCQQLRFQFPAGGWHHKSTGVTTPPSKDCIARKLGDVFEGWDVLIASGVQGPRQLSGYPPIHHDLTGQNPIEVEAHNWLAEQPDSGGGDGEPGDGEQKPDDDIAQVFLEALDRMDEGLTLIASGLMRLGEKVDVLNTRLEQVQRNGVPVKLG